MSESTNTVVFVLPQPLDPDAGGVQRITWRVGHFLAEQAWRVVFCSLAHEGHRSPDLGVLYHPDRSLAGDAAGLRVFIGGLLGRFQPDVVVNLVALDPEPRETLWQIRRDGGTHRIISCFFNNPAFFRDNVHHIMSDGLRRWPRLRFLAANRLVLRTILWVHRLRKGPLFQTAITQCDRFMLLAPTFSDELRWYVPQLDVTKVVAIPPPTQVPVGHQSDEKQNRILFVARIENSQKNVFLLPEIWARVQNRLPEWELHIVGDGKDLESLKEMFRKKGLQRVILHGKCEPFEHYRAAKIFLMISTYEGFGVTLIEAQVYGVVPVAFRSYSAIDWILNHGRDAVLVPPFDVDRLADEVEQIARDEERWSAMSAAARENARRFSEDVVGEQWTQLLLELAQERVKGRGCDGVIG